MFKYLIIISLLFIISACSFENSKEVKNKNIDGWQYKLPNGEWRKTSIPASIQNSLKRDTVLKTLFFGTTFLNNRWTDTVSWEYKTILKINKDIKNDNYELTFGRITGLADVYVNDSLLFTANNMFRTWKFDVSDLLKRGENTIYIKFTSLKEAKQNAQQNCSFNLPQNGYEMLRLAKYFVDTTMGIYYVPTGLTGNIVLTSWNKAKIDNVDYQIIDLEYNKQATIKISYQISAKNKTNVNLKFNAEDSLIFDKQLNLKSGINNFSYIFKINNPKLWWTHDLGTPYLYTFTSKLFFDEKEIQNLSNNYGIRKISIDTNNNNFHLKLNDKPLQLRVLNYLPLSIFLDDITKKDYSNTVDDFVKTGINMVHVDEKGIYEKSSFYNNCDARGILVWQDFMIPDKIFDTTGNFINNLRSEAIFQVKNLKKHACIAFWSGQNNFQTYYENYAQKSNYSLTDSVNLLNLNKLVFLKILPEIVKSYDSGSYYFENMNFKSIADLTSNLPSYPSISCIRRFTMQNNRTFGSRTIKHHEKPSNSDSIILSNNQRNNISVTNLQSMVYTSQLYAADNFEQRLIDARFNNNTSMIIMGNYRDYSPVISNSFVDFNGYWKGKMLVINRNLTKILVDMNLNNDYIDIDVLSDFSNNINADFYFKLYNFDGKVFWRKNMIGTTIYKNTSKKYFSFNISHELGQIGKNYAVLKIEIFYNQELYYEKYFVFAPDKSLKLKAPNVKKKFYDVDNGYVIELTSDYFARHVYIFTEKDGKFNNNFIDIAPGETQKVYFYTPNDIFAIENAFKLINYTQINNPDLFTLNQ